MSELTVEQIKKKRTGYLALSAIAMFFLGLIYAFSMFAGPICSYFVLEKADVALTFNIAMVVTACGTMFGAFLDMKFGLRFALICTGVLSLIGFAGTALFGYENLFVVYIFYGALAGGAAGMGNNLIVAATNLWFPEKVGFSSGVMMMCFSLSALVLGNVALLLIPLYGLSAVFIGIGILTCIVVVILAFILRRPPADIASAMVPEAAGTGTDEPGEKDAALKSPIFYVYWIWATIVFAIGIATIGNCASDAQSIGIGIGLATLLVGFVSMGNGLARFVVGLIYDKTNVKVAMGVDAGIAVLATVLISASFLTGNTVCFIVGALCCGFCYGGAPVMSSAFTRERFGRKMYPFNLSLANFAMVFGSLLNVIIQFAVGEGGRGTVYIVLSVLAVIALAIVFLFSKIWNKDMRMLQQREQDMAHAQSDAK